MATSYLALCIGDLAVIRDDIERGADAVNIREVGQRGPGQAGCLKLMFESDRSPREFHVQSVEALYVMVCQLDDQLSPLGGDFPLKQSTKLRGKKKRRLRAAMGDGQTPRDRMDHSYVLRTASAGALRGQSTSERQQEQPACKTASTSVPDHPQVVLLNTDDELNLDNVLKTRESMQEVVDTTRESICKDLDESASASRATVEAAADMTRGMLDTVTTDTGSVLDSIRHATQKDLSDTHVSANRALDEAQSRARNFLDMVDRDSVRNMLDTTQNQTKQGLHATQSKASQELEKAQHAARKSLNEDLALEKLRRALDSTQQKARISLDASKPRTDEAAPSPDQGGNQEQVSGLDQIRSMVENVSDVKWELAVGAWEKRFGVKCRPSTRFRCSAIRDGRHTFRSNDINMVVGDMVNEKFKWPVDLTNFVMEVVTVIRGEDCWVGLALQDPAYHSRNGKLPSEERLEGLQKELVKSSLRPSTSFVMAALAQIKPGDMMLDPMCGIGTIPIYAAHRTKGMRIATLGGDVEELSLNIGQNACGIHNLPTQLCRWDASRLPLRSELVDAVVSDLPFGIICSSAKVNNQTYPRLMNEFKRVLCVGGRAVLLTKCVKLVNQAVAASQVGEDETEWRNCFGDAIKVNIGGLENCGLFVLEKCKREANI